MKTLLILSDLWGTHHLDWLDKYTRPLSKYFEIKYYDCRLLGNIPLNVLEEKSLHNHFINGGITIAVENLLQLENKCDFILGFSIGGTIAWKACLKGLKTNYFFAVSSTRLRLETHKPLTEIKLFYGANDKHIPNEQWFNNMNIPNHIYPDQTHNFYRIDEIAHMVCTELIQCINDNYSKEIKKE